MCMKTVCTYMSMYPPQKDPARIHLVNVGSFPKKEQPFITLSSRKEASLISLDSPKREASAQQFGATELEQLKMTQMNKATGGLLFGLNFFRRCSTKAFKVGWKHRREAGTSDFLLWVLARCLPKPSNVFRSRRMA